MREGRATSPAVFAARALKPKVLLKVDTYFSPVGSDQGFESREGKEEGKEGKEEEGEGVSPPQDSFSPSPVKFSPSATISEDAELVEGAGGNRRVLEVPTPLVAVAQEPARKAGNRFGKIFGSSPAAGEGEGDGDTKKVRKRDRMKQTFVGFGKALPSPKKTMFGGFGTNLRKTMVGGMKSLGNKMGITTKTAGFSYKIEAQKARKKWRAQEAMTQDELVRSFVKTVVVLGSIKVIQGKKREYVTAFSDKRTWVGKERGEEEGGGEETPPLSGSEAEVRGAKSASERSELPYV